MSVLKLVYQLIGFVLASNLSDSWGGGHVGGTSPPPPLDSYAYDKALPTYYLQSTPN